MLCGSRAGFGLEFHVERDPGLLCVDVFVGGLHVNTWDNAFYPPLLVKKLKDEPARFRAPAPPPEGFTTASESFRVAESWMYDEAPAGSAFPSAAGAALARYAFLEWGECTDGVTAFAFPDGDQVHLACRLREEGGVTRGAEARHEPTVVSVSRAGLVDTLERGLAVAEREWAARRLTR
ncbi:hypothetical protein SAMN04487980_106211 [Streptomyces sp. cf124]|nr:hypothetical protein [Streptomyces caniscabiei]UJV45488.1 hypothetical protein CVT30_41625 [Streptomyces sp. AMCC400023]SFO10724.1 hypothetical protein SAMN04487980_106211 [Streptomyces sp. cf124]MBE4759595.1 hypothetical protein [Streptomyces caniscabiei]MBE4773121.1 hypothetical protein [Streptomyces caniscabiei]